MGIAESYVFTLLFSLYSVIMLLCLKYYSVFYPLLCLYHITLSKK